MIPSGQGAWCCPGSARQTPPRSARMLVAARMQGEPTARLSVSLLARTGHALARA
jgi:hypothetical protein